jgi:DNA-binding NarL/FixJ family response regulator
MKAIEGADSGAPLFGTIDTAPSLAEAIRVLERDADCDIAILDLHLGDSMGRESLVRMRERFPEVPVLVFTGDDSLENITMAFECGARGYATKSSPSSVLPNAVRLVLGGSAYIPPQAASILGFPQPTAAADRGTQGKVALRLSVRQEQVLGLLLKGMPNKVIAARLDMAEGTAKAHLNAVFRMLGVRTRVEAILRARELGLI